MTAAGFEKPSEGYGHSVTVENAALRPFKATVRFLTRTAPSYYIGWNIEG